MDSIDKADLDLFSNDDAKKMILEITSRYLTENTPTPKHPMRRKYADKRHLLDTLEQQGVIQTLNEAYVPAYAAFAFEDPKMKQHADNCVTLVVHALRDLYSAEGIRDYSFGRITEAALRLDPNATPECTQLGAILSTSFRTCVGSWVASGNAGVASISPDAWVDTEKAIKSFPSGRDLFFRIKGLDKENGF